MTGSLARQVALVTGGGRGIGRAVCVALAHEGAHVAVASRSESEMAETVELVNSSGGTAVAVATDVSDASSIKACVDQVVAELGPVDLLVNNAGSNRVVGPVWEIDPDAWWFDVTVNLRGSFLCARAVLPAMVARRAGRIVNIASGTAGRQLPYNTAYSSSKAALVRFTDCLAAETAEHGVFVFAVGPGNVETRMATDLQASELGQRWMGDTLNNLSFISPDVVSDAIVFLAQGRGDQLTGRWFAAADDVACLTARADEIVAGDLYQLRPRTSTS